MALVEQESRRTGCRRGLITGGPPGEV